MNLTAVIETTENCNLNCSFCLRPSFKKQYMSLDILEKIIAHLLEFAEDRVDFIWHGGEPLLIGLDFFKEILIFQEKHNKKEIIIKNNVQTNGTTLSKKFINFFEKENFDIGTSIQGTKEIHDSVRKDKAGNPTYDKIISNISKLKNKPSSIIVLTKEVLGKEKEIYESIKSLACGVRISEYFPGNASGEIASDKMPESQMPTPEEYGKSMLKFYEVWKADINPIEIKPITEMIRSFVRGESNSCLYSQKACNYSIIGIKSNGDFFTCLRGAGNKNFFLGNVIENPLRKRKKLSEFFIWERIKNLLEEDCKDCKFWNQCNGGCPQESIKLYGNMKHKTIYCEGRKMILNEISKDLGEKNGF